MAELNAEERKAIYAALEPIAENAHVLLAVQFLAFLIRGGLQPKEALEALDAAKTLIGDKATWKEVLSQGKV